MNELLSAVPKIFSFERGRYKVPMRIPAIIQPQHCENILEAVVETTSRQMSEAYVTVVIHGKTTKEQQ